MVYAGGSSRIAAWVLKRPRKFSISVPAPSRTRLLPTIKMYKIGVKLDLDGRQIRPH